MGNVNWMRARESQLASELFGARPPEGRCPIVRPGGSDSATFDNVLELLDARRPLAAARGDDDDPRGLRRPRRPLRRAEGLLRLPLVPHGAVGRPGRGRLHRRPRRRRHARPQRPAPGPLGRDEGRPRHPRLGDGDARRRAGPRHAQGPPGARASSSSSTSTQGRIVEDEEVKREVATRRPYGEWYRAHVVHFNDLEPALRATPHRAAAPRAPARLRLHPGGPARAARPDGGARARSRSARWATTPRSRCSPTSRPPLFSYFKQLFAQVTNPPIDPIRE